MFGLPVGLGMTQKVLKPLSLKRLKSNTVYSNPIIGMKLQFAGVRIRTKKYSK